VKTWLQKLWPRTLAAQVPLVVALAVAVAQILNAMLLLGARQIEFIGARSTFAERVCTHAAIEAATMAAPLSKADLKQVSTPFMTFSISPTGLSQHERLVRDPALEKRLRSTWEKEKIKPIDIEAGARKIEMRPNARPSVNPFDETFIAYRLKGMDDWYICQVVHEAPDKYPTLRLIVSTIVLFTIVLGVTLLVTQRIVRPLTNLSTAVARVGSNGRLASSISTDGPAEIDAVASALNEMSERINVLLKEKDAMLGAIGHDLRTPLTALRIRAENLPVSKASCRMIELIDHIASMLNAIVDLAKVGHNTEPPVRTDVQALATAIVEEFEDLRADVQLLPSLPIVHELRPHLFMQLLRNLVDNGIKYGQRVRIGLAQQEGTLIIRIEDDGPGIPSEEAERLVRPFERLETSRNRETGGSGLGLAIARIIANLHNANINFENSIDRPFCVVVTVPSPEPQPSTP
jgi:signal transduction histidine kinase